MMDSCQKVTKQIQKMRKDPNILRLSRDAYYGRQNDLICTNNSHKQAKKLQNAQYTNADG